MNADEGKTMEQLRDEVVTWDLAPMRFFVAKAEEINNDTGDAEMGFRLAYRLAKVNQKVDGDGKDA